MKTLAFLAALAVLQPALAVAQDLDDARAGTVAPSSSSSPALESLDNPGVFLKGFWKSVRGGNYFEAAALLVVFALALLHVFGKRIHDALPDEHWADRPLFFLFDTKPGGVLKLALTTAGAGVGGAYLVGEPITPELVKPILGVAFASSTIWGWVKDFIEWEGSAVVLRWGIRDWLLIALRLKGAPTGVS